MNISVIYATMTGHSRKIAAKVAEALGTTVANVKTNPALEDIDLLFIVGGIYGGQSSAALTAFVEKLEAGRVKNACLITTSLSLKTKQDNLRKALEEKGVNIVEEIACKGSFLWLFGFSHPNKGDLRRVTEKAKTIAAGI